MSGHRLGTEPSRLPPVDLATAFAKAAPDPALLDGGAPDRAAGLRGLALARKGPGAPAEEPATASSETMERHSAPAAKRTPASRGPGPSDGDDLTPQTIVVYLPVSLRDRLRAHHANSKSTYTTIVLEAVEATHAQLGKLLEAYRPPPRQGGLFSHHARPRVQHDEPQVQVSLRPSRADLAILDRLAADHHAPNRSALLAAALNQHLPDRPGS